MRPAPILALTALLFIGCATQRPHGAIIAGHYVSRVPGVTTELVLEASGKFTFTQSGFNGQAFWKKTPVQGYWVCEAGFIALNAPSEIEPKQLYFMRDGEGTKMLLSELRRSETKPYFLFEFIDEKVDDGRSAPDTPGDAGRHK